MFACNPSMQLAASQPRRHKVLMSFRYWNAWDVIFFDTDRMRFGHAPLDVPFNVLRERASLDHVEQLHTAADGQHRQVPLQRRFE